MNKKFSFTTDTATLSIFDLASLKHRVNDTPDWWSIPEDEIDEINKGNVLFLNLGTDGEYLVEIIDDTNQEYDTLFIKVPTGKVFIGAGEDTSGGDLEPDDSGYVSGEIINITPGNYNVQFRNEKNTIKLRFTSSENSVNNITTLIRI